VEALPKDLIDVVEVDASALEEVGSKLHISDIKLPGTIKIKAEPEHVIATVEMPRDQIAEADAALAEQEAAEGAAESEEGEAPEGGQEAPAQSTEAKPAEEAQSAESKE
ncbi:MAG TPA: hypothetical protein VFK11_00510, partial [Candidatus Saccharimonadales bacterium]|nr:hypothetical protein [Candidatus Saccharimonadales bacterium]